MLRKYLVVLLCLLSVCDVFASTTPNFNVPPLLLDNTGFDQHGSFTAEDLQHSPLLRSLFHLSSEQLGNNLARVCIEPSHQCKIVRNKDVVNVVNSNGIVKFDK